jgi:hypothetical protein
MHSNIILSDPPPPPRSSQWSLSFRVPTKPLHAALFFPMCATCPTYLILFYLIILIIFERCTSYAASILQPPASSLLRADILLNALLSDVDYYYYNIRHYLGATAHPETG